MIAMLVVPAYFAAQGEEADRHLAVVDGTGVLFERIVGDLEEGGYTLEQVRWTSTVVDTLRRLMPQNMATPPIRHPLSTLPLPGVAGYRFGLLRAFLLGPRRASPVALHVLATVPPLLPRRSELSYQPEFDHPCCLRPNIEGSASGVPTFRGHLAFTCVAAR